LIARARALGLLGIAALVVAVAVPTIRAQFTPYPLSSSQMPPPRRRAFVARGQPTESAP